MPQHDTCAYCTHFSCGPGGTAGFCLQHGVVFADACDACCEEYAEACCMEPEITEERLSRMRRRFAVVTDPVSFTKRVSVPLVRFRIIKL